MKQAKSGGWIALTWASGSSWQDPLKCHNVVGSYPWISEALILFHHHCISFRIHYVNIVHLIVKWIEDYVHLPLNWELSPAWEMSWLLIVHRKCCLNEPMPVESVRVWSPFSFGLTSSAGENFDVLSNVPNNVWKIKIALICSLIFLLTLFSLRSRNHFWLWTVGSFDFGPISLGMRCCFSSSWLFSENLRTVKIKVYLNPKPRFLSLRGF